MKNKAAAAAKAKKNSLLHQKQTLILSCNADYNVLAELVTTPSSEEIANEIEAYLNPWKVNFDN